jgi:hypothetical protein
MMMTVSNTAARCASRGSFDSTDVASPQALGKIRDDDREEALLSLTHPSGIQRRCVPCAWCLAANH